MNSACLSDDQLLALATGEPASGDLLEHVDHCAQCQGRVSDLRGEIADLRSVSGGNFDPLAKTVIGDIAGTSLPTGTVIGRYVVISDLGSGGQAGVYRVIDPELHRDLVLKLSHRQAFDGKSGHDSLGVEGRLLAALDHPGIVRIFDVGLHEGHPYLVLDYVLGRNLQQAFGNKPPSARDAAQLIGEVANAVHYAHERGIAHGDITPRNILIDSQGRTRLIDFGLSKIEDAWGASSGPRGGTPEFLPPEIITGPRRTSSFGPASDVFGLGATLYWLLTGQPPFAAATESESIARAARCDIDFDALQRARVPRDIARACQQSLAADPNQRPTAEALAAMLQGAFRRRSRLRSAATIVTTCLICIGLYWLWSELHEVTVRQATSIVHSVPKVTVDGIRDLSNVLPLRNGDRITIACNISQGEQATMLWFNAAGELHVYSPQRDVADRVDRMVYPAPHEELTLQSPEGTDLIFFCRGEPVSDQELRACFPIGRPLAPLPDQNHLELQRGEVALHGPLGKSTIPREIHQVETIMKGINRSLQKHFLGVTGIAFPHGRAL